MIFHCMEIMLQEKCGEKKEKNKLTFESCDHLQRFCPGGTIAGHLLQKYWQIITKIQVDYPTNHCQLCTGRSNTRCTHDEFDTQILNLMDNFEGYSIKWISA